MMLMLLSCNFPACKSHVSAWKRDQAAFFGGFSGQDFGPDHLSFSRGVPVNTLLVVV